MIYDRTNESQICLYVEEKSSIKWNWINLLAAVSYSAESKTRNEIFKKI